MKNGEIQYVRFKKDGKLLLETSGKAPVRFTISDLRF
jgi:hypothetical protein